MEFLIVLAILLAVVHVVTAPFRRPASAPGPSQAAAVEELEAEREAKYREIRDAELDHQTGKLSDDDFEALDLTLRGEAVEILRQLDEAATIGSR